MVVLVAESGKSGGSGYPVFNIILQTEPVSQYEAFEEKAPMIMRNMAALFEAQDAQAIHQFMENNPVNLKPYRSMLRHIHGSGLDFMFEWKSRKEYSKVVIKNKAAGAIREILIRKEEGEPAEEIIFCHLASVSIRKKNTVGFFINKTGEYHTSAFPGEFKDKIIAHIDRDVHMRVWRTARFNEVTDEVKVDYQFLDIEE